MSSKASRYYFSSINNKGKRENKVKDYTEKRENLQPVQSRHMYFKGFQL